MAYPTGTVERCRERRCLTGVAYDGVWRAFVKHQARASRYHISLL